jgi:hypothetical protein
MTPPDPELAQDPLVESLLRKVHEQSLQSPERSPFWRDGPWRCEFYGSQEPARLKVFRGDACVHEELLSGRGEADQRCRELKRVFLQSQRSGEEHSLLE